MESGGPRQGGPFPLTLNRDLKSGAVALVFGRHLAPVATGISGDHFNDLHLVSVDLLEKRVTRLPFQRRRKFQTNKHACFCVDTLVFLS